MSSDARSLERLNQLTSQLIDGDLSAKEAIELQCIVESNPTFQEMLVDQLVLDSLLIEEMGAESMIALVDCIGSKPTQKDRAVRTWPKWWSTRGQVVSAMAALLLVSLLAGLFFSGTSQASAKSLIAESRRIHQLALDRCYVVESHDTEPASKTDPTPQKIDANTKRRRSVLARAVGRVDRLWTRGDQFYIESSNDKHRWVWGMDVTGAVWLTLDSKLGLKLEPNEVPTWMETLTDTLSMRIDTLLDEVLTDFELAWETSEAQSSTRTVKATAPRSRLRRIREVRLEIDRETKVVLKISIDRSNRLDERTTTVFTLAATEAQPDSRYQIEGHLDERSVVLTNKNQPERRAELITRLFGQSP